MEDWKIFNLILKRLGKNENLSKFDLLREEVLGLIPNFTKMNELPTNINNGVNVTSSNFYSEHVNLKELDYFYFKFNF